MANFYSRNLFCLAHTIFCVFYSSFMIISGQYLETRIFDTKIQNSGSYVKKNQEIGWVGPSLFPLGQNWHLVWSPWFKARICSALGTNLFLDGPSSKSEELTSLLVEDTWDASSFSFSDCSDAGPNPLDWPLPRSPTGEKRGQTLKHMSQEAALYPSLTLHGGRWGQTRNSAGENQEVGSPRREGGSPPHPTLALHRTGGPAKEVTPTASDSSGNVLS